MKITFFLACGFAIAAFVCARLIEGSPPLGGPHPLAIFPRASVVATVVGYLIGVGAAVAMIRRDASFGGRSITRKRFIVACVLSAAATWGFKECWVRVDSMAYVNLVMIWSVAMSAIIAALRGGVIGGVIGCVSAVFIPRLKSMQVSTSQSLPCADEMRLKKVDSRMYPNRRAVLDIACVIGLIELVGGVLWAIGAGAFGGSQAYWLRVYFFILTGPMTLLPASLLAFKQPRWAGRWLIASAFVSALAAVLVMMPPPGTWSSGGLSWGAYVRKWSSTLIIPFSIPMLYLGVWLIWTNRRSAVGPTDV